VLLTHRREWLPILGIVSTLLVVSAFNDCVEPVVVRARHFAQILPLGFVLIAVAVVVLHDRLATFVPRHLAQAVALLILSSLLIAQQLSHRTSAQAPALARSLDARPLRSHRFEGDLGVASESSSWPRHLDAVHMIA
jgi:hypothetical protein